MDQFGVTWDGHSLPLPFPALAGDSIGSSPSSLGALGALAANAHDMDHSNALTNQFIWGGWRNSDGTGGQKLKTNVCRPIQR